MRNKIFISTFFLGFLIFTCTSDCAAINPDRYKPDIGLFEFTPIYNRLDVYRFEDYFQQEKQSFESLKKLPDYVFMKVISRKRVLKIKGNYFGNIMPVNC